jgi:hypothetical protein
MIGKIFMSLSSRHPPTDLIFDEEHAAPARYSPIDGHAASHHISNMERPR